MMKKNFIKDYDSIATKFAKSRKNMKWEEIDYFIDTYIIKKRFAILDVGCGSGRLLEQLETKFDVENINYKGIDRSSEMIEEAKKNFPQQDFQVLNMENLNTLTHASYDYVFFIASFHHIKLLKDRVQTMENLYNILPKGATVFMTNWALNSEINNEKYSDSKVIFEKSDFENIDDYHEKLREKQFGSSDYSIEFGKFHRYYHCFSIEELNHIFSESGFRIVENRLFDSQKNIISVIKK